MDPNTLKLLMGSAGAGAVADKLYIEDVFSTFLYTGTGSAGSVVNGIDLLNKGGLVWRKGRNTALSHYLHDTQRSPQTGMPSSKRLSTDTANGEFSDNDYITSWNNDGFSFGTGNSSLSGSGNTVVSWTFRKAANFFDVVTYTGNGNNRTISHNLGSIPGTIIVKRTDTTGNWTVYHRSLTNTQYLMLNATDSVFSGGDVWNSTTPTSTVFSIGTNNLVNSFNATYVAYLFAHDAGGFGDSGNDNVISCGSYTGNGSTSGPTVTLGWEPQWLLVKVASGGTGGWWLVDNMRGLPTDGSDSLLLANVADAETSGIGNLVDLTPTGFSLKTTNNGVNGAGRTYIYIAIRRGPMKTPTDATKVFGLSARTGTGANATVTGGQLDDAVLIKNRGSAVGALLTARLTGNNYMQPRSSAAELTSTTVLQDPPWDLMDGIKVGTTSTLTNASANTFINYLFRRAPGFFDVVAYTGDGSSSQPITHNLSVLPNLVIVKSRSLATGWSVFWGLTSPLTGFMSLNSNAADTSSDTLTASSTSFTAELGIGNGLNTNGANYIAYLFASCPGVSKFDSYTGTGTTQQINCGFTAGARFVLIKRTDSTGDWYVWDTARGIISANDPFFLLNSTAAENTTTDYIDPLSTGFEISSTAPAAINANGGSYIYLAIA